MRWSSAAGWRALAVLALFAATTLRAQQTSQSGIVKSNTRHLFVGAGINASAIRIEDGDANSGGGLWLTLGYGFTPSFAAFIEVAGASIVADSGGNFAVGHFELGARYHFANPNRRWIPFLEAAVTARAVTQDDVPFCDPACSNGDISMSGGGFTFGGGVMYYALPWLALNGTLKWTVGELADFQFNEVTVSGLELDTMTSRLNLGVIWFLRRQSQ